MHKKVAIIGPANTVHDLRQYYRYTEVQVDYETEESLIAEEPQAAAARLLSAKYDGFIGLVDWSSLFAAYLNNQIGAPAPDLTVVMTLQDKLLSRSLQKRHALYSGIALDSDKVEILQPNDWPLFVKPRRGTMAYKAVQVNSMDDACKIFVSEMPHAFAEGSDAWIKLYDLLGASIRHYRGLHHFVIESLVPTSVQLTLDGYVSGNTVQFFGFTKSYFYPKYASFRRFDYPYGVEKDLHDRVISHARQFISKSGFNHSLFNIEYMVDQTSGRFDLLEINTRPSSQFMYPIQYISGVHPIDIAIQLVLGRQPDFLPTKISNDTVSVMVFRRTQDAIVKNMPNQAAMDWFYSRSPKGRWSTYAQQGHRLSEYPCDSHSYRYAELTVPLTSDKSADELEKVLRKDFDELVDFEDIVVNAS